MQNNTTDLATMKQLFFAIVMPTITGGIATDVRPVDFITPGQCVEVDSAPNSPLAPRFPIRSARSPVIDWPSCHSADRFLSPKQSSCPPSPYCSHPNLDQDTKLE